jgi:peptidoglycan hydrolase FlgJ
MDPLSPATPGTPSTTAPPLTTAQTQALSKLHDAAVQLESIFVNEVFKEIRKATPQDSLFGPPSQAQQIFGEMLDQKRADQVAQSGSLGIAKVIEQQLRSAVLASTPASPPRVPAEETDKQ